MNEITKKKILISGGGVAGIICALSLDPQKYEIDIIERGDSFRNIGFSITLWKSGFRLLKPLLDQHNESFLEGTNYFPVKGFTLFAGLVLRKLKQLNAVGYAWVIERSHLMDILEHALLAKMGKDGVTFSKTINSIEHEDNKEIVTFNDNTKKEYDFVIIAEGINSSTRSLVFPKEEKIVPLGQSLRYAWFNKETNLGESGAIFFTKNHIGVIHPPYTRNLLGYYFKDNTSLEDQQAFEIQMFGVIKKPDGTETSIDRDTSHVFNLKNVYLPKYHKGNVVFIGDAAHGRPPTLGFGTSLAIEDAVMICQKLNEVDSFTRIDATLEMFSRVRAERIEEVYRFQDFIHKFITSNAMKVRVLTFCLQLFYAKYMEYKVKKLASYQL